MKTTTQTPNPATTPAMIQAYWHKLKALPVSFLSAAVALVLGVCMGCLTGFNAYHDTYTDELLVEVYYVDNPTDCPPRDEGKIYERFYLEPPRDNQLPKRLSSLLDKGKGGALMDP